MTAGRLTVVAAAALAVFAAAAGVEAQCAMCRRALESPDALPLAAALRSGVLVLLAAPFALFGVVAALAVRTQRQRRSADHGPLDTSTTK